jgi:hypothetical protein
MSALSNNPYLLQQMNQQAPQSSIDMSGLFPGASSGLQDILKQLQTTQNQANTANQQRYQDVLGMYSNLGQTESQAIAEQGQQQQAKSTQDLMARGLGNTTVTGAMSRGIASDTQSQQTQLQEGLAAKEAGVMQSMNQQGPDMSMYANLIKSAASGQQQPVDNTAAFRSYYRGAGMMGGL